MSIGENKNIGLGEYLIDVISCVKNNDRASLSISPRVIAMAVGFDMLPPAIKLQVIFEDWSINQLLKEFQRQERLEREGRNEN